jgi:hypothetical protein
MTHTHERRRRSRHKTNIPIYVRHASPHDRSLEEALLTVNACSEGVYFFTTESLYQKGTRLFVTFPYSTAPGAINRDYIAVVKRVDPLENRYYGIAVKLLGTLALDRM